MVEHIVIPVVMFVATMVYALFDKETVNLIKELGLDFKFIINLLLIILFIIYI